MNAAFCWLKKLITTKDNKNPCVVRLMCWAAFFYGNGLYGYEVVWNKVKFDFTMYCAGVGVLVALMSAGVALKQSDEPNNTQETANDKPTP